MNSEAGSTPVAERLLLGLDRVHQGPDCVWRHWGRLPNSAWSDAGLDRVGLYAGRAGQGLCLSLALRKLAHGCRHIWLRHELRHKLLDFAL